jgi:hypothetical protein
LVGIEVCLLDTAVLERDVAVESGGYAEDDRALDLCTNRIRVDDLLPQSTAQTTRRTWTAPVFATTSTSATWAI